LLVWGMALREGWRDSIQKVNNKYYACTFKCLKKI